MEGSRPGGIAPFPGMRISPEGRPPRQRAASGKFLREQDANPFFRQPPSIEACRVGRGSAARAAARPRRPRRSPRKIARAPDDGLPLAPPSRVQCADSAESPRPSKPAGWAEAVQPGLLLAPGDCAAAREKSPRAGRSALAARLWEAAL